MREKGRVRDQDHLEVEAPWDGHSDHSTTRSHLGLTLINNSSKRWHHLPSKITQHPSRECTSCMLIRPPKSHVTKAFPSLVMWPFNCAFQRWKPWQQPVLTSLWQAAFILRSEVGFRCCQKMEAPSSPWSCQAGRHFLCGARPQRLCCITVTGALLPNTERPPAPLVSNIKNFPTLHL